MTNTDIYQDIAARTGGSLFVGVLGPVRNIQIGRAHV